MAVEKGQARLIDPHEVPAPKGAEGWQDIYKYFPHLLFSKENEEIEDSMIWLQLNLQAPSVLYPVDISFGFLALARAHGYANALLSIPTSFGATGGVKIANGYIYASPRTKGVADPELVEERTPIFRERVKFFVDNWDELWNKWVEKNLEIAEEIEDISWPELKLIEDWGTGGPQSRLWDKEYTPSGLSLLKAWGKFKELAYERLYVHFDLIDVSYISYSFFREYCLKAFPGIEEKEIAIMLAGVEQPVLEGDFHLRELAELAVELGIQERFKNSLEPQEILKGLEKIEGGRKWLEKWEGSKFWFHLTNGNGMYHKNISWLEDLSIPFKFLRSYISDVEKGKRVAMEREEKAKEALKLFEGYRELLPTEEDKKAFTEVWEGARKTAPALEGHAYYSDHWIFSSICQKLREFGRYLQNHGILKNEEDIFLLYDFEIDQILPQVTAYWYVQKEPSSWLRPYWDEIEKRKRIIKVLENYTPPLLLMSEKAKPPEGTPDPVETALWGFTREKLEQIFRAPEKIQEIRGWAASPGLCEGPARVIQDPINELDWIQEGDILVTPFLSPSQVVAFERIKGLVTDGGGLISHPAIVAREYGIPAVVGTGIGTNILKDVMKIRLDATKGVVTILE